MVLIWGWSWPPGNIWQCLKILRVVTAGEEGAAGTWWVASHNTQDSTHQRERFSPNVAGAMGKNPCLCHFLIGRSDVPGRCILLSLDSLKPTTQVKSCECAFQTDLLGATSQLCLELCWQETDHGMPSFKLKVLSFTFCN